MSNCKFIYDNKLIGGTISGTNINSDYAIANVINGIPSMIIETTGNSTYIKIDMGANAIIQAVSIHNHTIDIGATVLAVFSNDNFSTTTNIDISDSISALYSDAYYFIGQSYNHRYFGLNITGASGTFQIGEIFAGLAFEPATNFNWGFSEFYFTDSKIKSHGQHYKSSTYDYRGYKINFENMASTGVIRTAVNKIIRDSAVVFVPDAAVTDCLHGIVLETQLERIGLPNGASKTDSFELTFVENAAISRPTGSGPV